MQDSEYSQWLNRTGTEVLIERLNHSDQREQAASDLWKRIEPAIVGRMKWIIGQKYKGQIGEDSIANHAFADVLEKHAEGKVTFHDRDGLLSLLMTIAKLRYIDRLRAKLAIKRGGLHDELAPYVSPDADANEHAGNLMRQLLGIEGNFAHSDDVLGRGKPTKQINVPMPKEHRACNQPVDSNLLDSHAGVDRLDLFLQGFDPEISAVVREKVDTLPKDLRTVFELLAILEHTQEKAAQILGVTRDFVRYKLELIRKHFSPPTID